jgi:carboxymethylenebutenolidase
MKVLRKILIALGVLLLAIIVFLAASIVVDALIGGNRVEQMTNTTIVGPDGQEVRAYVARPDAPGTYPGVVMIHEFFGLRPDIIEKAEALADEGYVVVAPDTYRGKTTGWIPRAIFLRVTTQMEQVVGDLDATFDWLAGQSDVDPDRVAVMGFCYGGDAALQYSLAHPKPAGTGIFYGSLVTDPAQLQRLPGPVLGIFGAEDASIPLAEVNAFQVALDAARIPNQITVYPGVGHAFVGGIDEIRAGGAPGEAWAEFLAWLEETIGK